MAVQALGRLRRSAGAAHHYGTFQLTDEAIDAPVIALGEALDEAKGVAGAIWRAEAGQVFQV